MHRHGSFRSSRRSLLTASLVLLSLWTAVSVAEDCDAPADADEVVLCGSDGVQMFVTRKGGVIRAYRKSAKNDTTGTTVTIFIDSVTEVDSTGKAISKHAVNSYSKATFPIPTKKTVDLSGVSAECLESLGFITQVDSAISTQVKLSVCIVKGNGTITMDSEVSTVTENQIKISFSMTWSPWDPTGAFLDVDINFKIPPGQAIKQNDSPDRRLKPTKFMLGDAAFTEFSVKAKIDKTTWVTMPDGFPKYEAKGANNIITFRVPKFNSSVDYDPTVDLGPPGIVMKGGVRDAPACVALLLAAVASFLLL